MTELNIHMNEEKTKNEELLFSLSICGDTYEKKETIKKLGYKYTSWCYSWKKEVSLSELENAIEEALENDIVLCSFEMGYNKLCLMESIIYERFIKSVQVPEILKDKKFNKKIYGKEGSCRVYLDNKEIKISDEQAAEIQEWLLIESKKKDKEFIDQIVHNTASEDRIEIRRVIVKNQIEAAQNIRKKYMKEEEEV